MRELEEAKRELRDAEEQQRKREDSAIEVQEEVETGVDIENHPEEDFFADLAPEWLEQWEKENGLEYEDKIENKGE